MYIVWKIYTIRSGGDRILEREVNPVMSHIRRIRGKFETIGIDSIIKTIWGVGYKLNA